MFYAARNVSSLKRSRSTKLHKEASRPVAIYRLIANGSFGPEEVAAMTAAYEDALLELCLNDRDDPITELVARAIVNITSTGERDPLAIRERALNTLGIRRANVA